MDDSTSSEQQKRITALQIQLKSMESHIRVNEKKPKMDMQQHMLELDLETKISMSIITWNNVKLAKQDQETMTIIEDLESKCTTGESMVGSH